MRPLRLGDGQPGDDLVQDAERLALHLRVGVLQGLPDVGDVHGEGGGERGRVGAAVGAGGGARVGGGGGEGARPAVWKEGQDLGGCFKYTQFRFGEFQIG